MGKGFKFGNIFNRYLFVFVTLLLLLVGVLNVLIPQNNEAELNKKKVNELIVDYLKNKLNGFNLAKETFEKKYLNALLNNKNPIIKLPNEKISIEGLNKHGELVYWHNIKESKSKIFLQKKYTKQKFANIQNQSYYYKISEFNINSDIYTIIYYIKIDKLDKDNTAKDLSDFLSKELGNSVKANYDDFNSKNRIYFGKQISVIDEKNSENYYQSTNSNPIKNIFYFILFIWFIIIAVVGYINLRSIKNDILYITSSLIFTIIFRYIIFYFDLSNSFYFKDYSNPANYSSSIAYGILKSPIDLTISLAFLSLFVYHLICRYKSFKINKLYNNVIITLIITVGSSYIAFLLVRIIKSFFYDGNLRFFKIGNFEYNSVTYLMLFNALIIGVLYVALLLFFYSLIVNNISLRMKFKLMFLSTIVLIVFIITDILTKTRIGETYLFLIINVLVIVLVIVNKGMVFNTKRGIVISLFTGALLINFIMGAMYTRTENDKLKLAYFELTRIDDNIIKFFIKESLIRAENNFAINNFSIESDYKYEAYKLWNNSKIKGENLITEFYFLDSTRNFLGGVNFSFPYEHSKNWFNEGDINVQKIIIDTVSGNKSVIISGITPIANGKYYFVVSVLYNKHGFNFSEIPTVLNTNINNKIYFDDYRMFWVKDYSITYQKADIDISRDEIIQILNSAKYNNGFSQKLINSQRFLFYADKDSSPDRYLIIGYKTRDFSWNIYDFVKIFLVHLTYIICLSIIIFTLSLFKNGLPSFNYQARLLTAFLVVTIIPLIILAFYFEDSIKDKLENSIRLNLMAQSDRTANFLERYGNSSKITLRDLIIKANTDLDINFTLFSENEVKYSTYLDYYYLGELSFYLDYSTYKDFEKNKISETFIKTSLNKQPVYSYYKKIFLQGKYYILEVNDSVNRFYMVFDTSEINLFLYGIYSFAIIIIVLMSILLTKRISKPILNLTKAAGEVANGNFDISLEIKEKGDIGNLLQSFNFMVKELKRIKEELSIKEREAAWKEMAKQVAHEIKNPLTPMKLSIQLLIQAFNDKSPKFNDIFNKVTVTVSNQIETLKRIADEFSVVAKLPPLNISTYNLIEILNDIIKLYAGENINIFLSSSNNSIMLKLDSEQFKRVIINLIKNSIEADSKNVNFEVTETKTEVVITIEDDGIGIDETNKNKIFEDKFTTKTEGSGIGLSIVKNTLSAFNSKIELVESKKGKTIFKINFIR